VSAGAGDRRVQAPFGARQVTVTARERHGPYVVLGCADPAGPRPQAGQFYMLRATARWGGGEAERPYLPRAFSVLRAAADGDELQFLLEDVGPGTERLCELVPGDELSIVGPLGTGFTTPPPGRRRLLLGGGVGIAPLAILRQQLAESASADSIGRIARGPILPGPSSTTSVLLGFRDGAHAAGAELLPDARVATDDGSVGHHGLVTDLLIEELDADPHVQVYACGPPPMLEAVRSLCAARNPPVPAQLALESGMACGFGACFGCVVATRDGYLRLCVDGPVLDSSRLEAVT
jgi:dihydroorotate dehydrogenase electron transfer subunit